MVFPQGWKIPILIYRYFSTLSRESDEVFSKTDQAIEKLDPWRTDIPLAVFQSKIRFSLRLEDLRIEALDPKIEVDIDTILDFFNPVILQTITTYTKDIESFSERKKTWKYVHIFFQCHNEVFCLFWKLIFLLWKLVNDRLPN